jgi:hypothetical protein
MLQILKDRESTTLGAGPTELLTSSGIGVGGYQRLSFVLVNTGAADLTDLAVYWLDSYTGTDWSPADEGAYLPAGTLPAGDSVEITITDLSRAKMRIVVSGTAAETVRLTLSATWS